VTFRTDYARATFLLLLCGLFIWLTYSLVQQSGLYERIMGWIGLPIIAFGTLNFIANLMGRGPTVVISDTGILDRRLRVGEIPWRDIVAIDIVQNRGARYLKLKLRDPSSYFERMPLLQGILARIIYSIGLSPFCIAFVGLTPGLDDAYFAITEKLASIDT